MREETERFFKKITEPPKDIPTLEELTKKYKKATEPMPNQGYTKIVMIVDESGSMHRTRNDTIGGYNSFIDEQRKVPGTADVTMCLFSNSSRSLMNNVNINKDEVKLNSRNYCPNGSTALYDAIGSTITEVGKTLSEVPEPFRPEKVVVVIMTDGEENASKSYTRQQINDMITHQREKYAWEFVFLGANQDAFTEASKIGIARGSTMTYSDDSAGIKMSANSLSSNIRRYRSGGQSASFTPEEQEAAEKLLKNENKLS